MSRVHTTAAVLSIGDELVLGQSLDTNSKWISEQLIAMGIRVVEHATVGDDVGPLGAAFGRLMGSVDLVISTGGLGPTDDDLTRAALAAATGDELVEDAGALAAIESWYSGRVGGAMPESNRNQAFRPRRAVCLPNEHGTAPGLLLTSEHADVICLPGPPHEMRAMFEGAARAHLNPPGERVVETRVLRTIGIGESTIADRLGDLMARDRNPVVGTTADIGAVGIRLRHEGPASASGERLDSTEAVVRELLAPHVFGVDHDTIESVVVRLLRERGEHVAVVESCTGGLVGGRLTNVAGCSDVVSGGWITYTNAMKSACVGVPDDLFGVDGPGAVSREVAVAMATGALDRAVHEGGVGVDRAVAVTGVAGPGGGTEAKPVGTVWIALACRDRGPTARRFVFHGGRAAVREWSVQSALGALWLGLIGRDDAQMLREHERWSG